MVRHFQNVGLSRVSIPCFKTHPPKAEENVKIKYEKGNILFIFFEKKSLDLKKIEIILQHFPHWFWFGKKNI
jgi:hypothetical protein